MNYHLLIDEKFIDDFISDAESVSDQNVYIYMLSKPSKHVKSNLGVFAPLDSSALKEIIGQINTEDKVFVHCYQPAYMAIINQLPKQTQVYLLFWGADFFVLPYNCGYKNKISRFPYETKSFNYLKNLVTRSRIVHFKSKFKATLKSKKPIQIIEMLIKLPFEYLAFFNDNYNYVIAERTNFLKRLTAVCHWNRIDIDILESLYDVKLKMLPFSYGVGVEKFKDLEEVKTNNIKETSIFLGNSDTLTNNHLDAFELLKKFRHENIKIYCPLNYEKNDYAKYISEKGREIFGDRFIPLLDYLPRSEYYKMMDSIDVCLMYHIRSQAGGNILAFLKKGVKVYLNNQSSIYKLYRSLNIPVFDAETISVDKIYSLKMQNDATQKSNLALWENYEKRKKDLQYLLS